MVLGETKNKTGMSRRWKGKKGKCWNLIRQIVFKKYGTNCFTCPRTNLVGTNLQCGHYLTVAVVGSNNRLSWDINQLRPQCSYCNGVGQGEQVRFRFGLVKQLGEEKVQELEARRHKIDPIKNWDKFYEELKAQYGEE